MVRINDQDFSLITIIFLLFVMMIGVSTVARRGYIYKCNLCSALGGCIIALGVLGC